jgi:hypothetical protein
VKRLTTDILEALDARLQQALETDRGVGYQETVTRLAPKIQQLRGAGVPFDQIVALLKETGLNLSASTLRSYLRRSEKIRARGTRSRSPGPLPQTEATPEHPGSGTPLGRTPPAQEQQTTDPAASPPRGGGRKEGDGAAVQAGHFAVTPDSDRV